MVIFAIFIVFAWSIALPLPASIAITVLSGIGIIAKILNAVLSIFKLVSD